MFVRTVHPSACISILAGNIRMDIKAFVTISALREELTLFSWVMVFALLGWEITFWPVLTSNLAFISSGLLRLQFGKASAFIFLIAFPSWSGILFYRSKPLQPFAMKFLRLSLCHLLFKVIESCIICALLLLSIEVAFLKSLVSLFVKATLFREPGDLITKTRLFVTFLLKLCCLRIRLFMSVASRCIRILLIIEWLSLLEWLACLEIAVSLLPRWERSLLSFDHIVLFVSLDQCIQVASNLIIWSHAFLSRTFPHFLLLFRFKAWFIFTKAAASVLLWLHFSHKLFLLALALSLSILEFSLFFVERLTLLMLLEFILSSLLHWHWHLRVSSVIALISSLILRSKRRFLIEVMPLILVGVVLAILWPAIVVVLIELVATVLPVVWLVLQATKFIIKALLVIVLEVSSQVLLLLGFTKAETMRIFLTRLILQLYRHLSYLRRQWFEQIFHKLLCLVLEEHMEIFKYIGTGKVALDTDSHDVLQHLRLRLCSHHLLVLFLKIFFASKLKLRILLKKCSDVHRGRLGNRVRLIVIAFHLVCLRRCLTTLV